MGSIKTNCNSDGCFFAISDIINEFKPTDFPEPVVPATKRCGIFAKSRKTGFPLISTPTQIGKAYEVFKNSSVCVSGAKSTLLRFSLGNSNAINCELAIDETLTPLTPISRLISLITFSIALNFEPFESITSAIVTSGPSNTFSTVAENPKFARTIGNSS